MSTARPPALPLSAWEPTKETLHLYAQVVGKVRLATASPRNHWWHAALHLDMSGLTTRRMHHHGVTFQITFDFLQHLLRVRAAGGRNEFFALHDGLSVAEFDRRLHEVLERLGLDVRLVETPYGVPMTTPFPDDTEHASYDAEQVRNFWRVLDWTDSVFEEFAGWYVGKTSPIQLYWHSFDLAMTRFSGRRAPALPDADPVTREAYSHEVISFGFWAGDQTLREPAFYSYTAPEPDGVTTQPLVPDSARWTELPAGRLALLPYDEVRTAPDPRRTLLAFLQSAYDAGSRAAGWARHDLESSYCPTPPEMRALLSGALART
jgi:hypothetical protein